MPKVSVIVPIYNVEQYLDEALRSLSRQTLDDMEFVLVNDGSKDSSLEIMKRWAADDPRFVIIDKENGGYGKAMNVGLDRATGEYIGILEPDDFVLLDMFEDLYKVAHENDLDFVKADFFRFTTNDESGDMNLYYNHLDKSDSYYGRVVNPSMDPVLTKFIMNTWSGIYKRSFLNDNNIRHHETPGASFQDNGFFWLTFVYAKRAMFIRRPYYMNRRDNPNSSVNNRGKVYAMNQEYDYIRHQIRRRLGPEVWDRFKYYFFLKRFHNYMFTYQRIAPEFYTEYSVRIGEEFKRAKRLGEIDESLFTDLEKKKMLLLMTKPEAYPARFAPKKTAAPASSSSADSSAASSAPVYVTPSALKAEKRLQEIENSTTWKVGKAVMYVPTHAKEAIKKARKQQKK